MTLSGIEIGLAVLCGLALCGLTGLLGSMFLRRQKAPSKTRFTQVRHLKRTRPMAKLTPEQCQEKRDSLRRKGKFLRVILADAQTREEIAKCWVLDRSLGGLCLQTEQPFPVGQFVSIRPDDHMSAASWVRTEIKNCREEEDGYWKVGCAFTETMFRGTLVHFG